MTNRRLTLILLGFLVVSLAWGLGCGITCAVIGGKI